MRDVAEWVVEPDEQQPMAGATVYRVVADGLAVALVLQVPALPVICALCESACCAHAQMVRMATTLVSLPT